MVLIAQIGALVAGVWLVGLGVWMALRPRSAISALSKMGGSPSVHFGELTIRLLIGVALMGAAPESRAPDVLWVIGGFLVLSAVVLMILPRRWHAAYSAWWAARIPVGAVRLIALLSALAGSALIWSLGWPTLS